MFSAKVREKSIKMIKHMLVLRFFFGRSDGYYPGSRCPEGVGRRQRG